MKKIAKQMLLSLLALNVVESASALDSGAQNLTTTTGATDYFKINCAGDTDHLNFKLLENAVAEIPVTPTPPETKPVSEIKPPLKPLPQVLNAKLTIAKLSATASAISVGTSKEVSLKGGNGSYNLKLDTVGTDSSFKTPQAYSVQYQCLNSAGKITNGSSTVTGTLNIGKAKTYTIKCNKSKTSGDTSSLKLIISNKTAVTKSTSAALVIETPATGELMAQIIANRREGSVAFNTIGDVLDVKSGNGDYFVMVNSPINAAKNYRFQYSCLNASDIEAKTSLIQVLQDQ